MTGDLTIETFGRGEATEAVHLEALDDAGRAALAVLAAAADGAAVVVRCGDREVTLRAAREGGE